MSPRDERTTYAKDGDFLYVGHAVLKIRVLLVRSRIAGISQKLVPSIDYGEGSIRSECCPTITCNHLF